MLRSRDIIEIFKTFDENLFASHLKKSKYPLFRVSINRKRLDFSVRFKTVSLQSERNHREENMKSNYLTCTS